MSAGQSWIIVSRQTGKPVCETWARGLADRAIAMGYEVLTPLEWMGRHRQLVKAAGGIEPSDEAYRKAIASEHALS